MASPLPLPRLARTRKYETGNGQTSGHIPCRKYRMQQRCSCTRICTYVVRTRTRWRSETRLCGIYGAHWYYMIGGTPAHWWITVGPLNQAVAEASFDASFRVSLASSSRTPRVRSPIGNGAIGQLWLPTCDDFCHFLVGLPLVPNRPPSLPHYHYRREIRGKRLLLLLVFSTLLTNSASYDLTGPL